MLGLRLSESPDTGERSLGATVPATKVAAWGPKSSAVSSGTLGSACPRSLPFVREPRPRG